MFKLDERIKNDTIELGKIGINKVLLAKDSNYPWIILVPEVEGISEIHQLSAEQQQETIKTTSFIATKLESYFQPAKINIANIGNIVNQLHIHVVARFKEDLAWPGPIWGHSPSGTYEKEELDVLCNNLKDLLHLN